MIVHDQNVLPLTRSPILNDNLNLACRFLIWSIANELYKQTHMLIAFTNENVYWWFVTTNTTYLSILCIYNIINASQLWLRWYIMYIIIARCTFQVTEWLTILKVVRTTQEQGITYNKINLFLLNEALIGSRKGKRKIKFVVTHTHTHTHI
jgi:hypothetical protein